MGELAGEKISSLIQAAILVIVVILFITFVVLFVIKKNRIVEECLDTNECLKYNGKCLQGNCKLSECLCQYERKESYLESILNRINTELKKLFSFVNQNG